MECLAQYLDNLEDLIYAVALKAERIRQALRFSIFVATAISLQAACIVLALTTPPVAVAVASLLLVSMLYRAVVADPPAAAEPSTA